MTRVPFFALLRTSAQHVVVFLRPEEVLAHRPQVDDVADEEEIFDFDRFQELEQQVGAAPARTQVDVGYEDCPELCLLAIFSVSHSCLSQLVGRLPEAHFTFMTPGLT